jgi:hypothetical protein
MGPVQIGACGSPRFGTDTDGGWNRRRDGHACRRTPGAGQQVDRRHELGRTLLTVQFEHETFHVRGQEFLPPFLAGTQRSCAIIQRRQQDRA